MKRFHGEVGYGESVELAPGVHDYVITARNYFGDIIRNTRRLDSGENLNNDISVGNSISIVADAYAHEHFFAMKYIKWAGVNWIISEVEVQSPRLILRLGGVYNGPTAQAGTPDTP